MGQPRRKSVHGGGKLAGGVYAYRRIHQCGDHAFLACRRRLFRQRIAVSQSALYPGLQYQAANSRGCQQFIGIHSPY